MDERQTMHIGIRVVAISVGKARRNDMLDVVLVSNCLGRQAGTF